MGSDVKIARALISVTDKTGVVDFARTLVDDFGVEIISTGGTARAIEDAGVPVRTAAVITRSSRLQHTTTRSTRGNEPSAVDSVSASEALLT